MAEIWTPELLKSKIAGQELKVKEWLWITHAIAEKAWIDLRKLKNDVLKARGNDRQEKEEAFNAAKNALLSLANEIWEKIVMQASRRKWKNRKWEDIINAYAGDTFTLENKTTEEISDNANQEWNIKLSNWGDVKIDTQNSTKTFFTGEEWKIFSKDANEAQQQKAIKVIIAKSGQKFGSWTWTPNNDINWWTFEPKWAHALSWDNKRYILQSNGKLELQK